ncbi:MAG: sec-independent protein translocase protein TatA [Psychromonas sp.]|jgi:sec-independent protein translocase protein TatA
MLLFLNDIAGSEILLILVFILMFFGAKSIPGIARTMGRTIRQIKQASQDVQSEIRKSGVDIKKDMNFQNFVQDATKEIKAPMDQYAQQVSEVTNLNSQAYNKPKPVGVVPPLPVEIDKKEIADKSEPINEKPKKDSNEI